MRESASKSMNQPRSQFVSNMAAYWGGFEDKDDADSCMSCLDTTKYRCLRCKFPMCNKSWKCWKFVAHCAPCLKEAFEQGTQYSTHAVGCFRSFWSKGSIFTVSFKKERALFWARACLLYMHESSLLTYLHIPSVFHNQHPCNGDRELYSGRNIDFTLKNHYPARPLF